MLLAELISYPRKIVILQHGQWELLSSHGSTQFQWNLWAHGRWTNMSPSWKSSKHTAQSACSDAFHLNLLQLNFLEENTCLCTLPRILCSRPWLHPSLLPSFMHPKLLCLQLIDGTWEKKADANGMNKAHVVYVPFDPQSCIQPLPGFPSSMSKCLFMDLLVHDGSLLMTLHLC